MKTLIENGRKEETYIQKNLPPVCCSKNILQSKDRCRHYMKYQKYPMDSKSKPETCQTLKPSES